MIIFIYSKLCICVCVCAQCMFSTYTVIAHTSVFYLGSDVPCTLQGTWNAAEEKDVVLDQS